MQELHNFYSNQLEKHNQNLNEISKTINVVRLFRFLIFSGLIIGVYFTFQISYTPIIIGAVGVIIFGFLVVKHQNLKEKRNLIRSKISFNETELSILNGDFFDRPTGEEFIEPLHHYSNDVDLFGRGSFFQYLNRTATIKGKELLASLLTANNIESIEERQKTLQELSQKSTWRENFTALAQLVSPTQKQTSNISRWIETFEVTLPSFLRVLPKIFSAISLILIGLVSFDIVSFSAITLWFFIGLGISMVYFKKTQSLYTSASSAKDIFKQYYLLLEQIETESFKTDFLKQKQSAITTGEKKSSAIFKEFSGILNAFDQRNNLLIAIVGNGLFLWDINNAAKTEHWITTYKNVVDNWFHVVDFFDAYNSLANFVFNHPNYSFPSIASQHQTIKASSLGHPLLKIVNRVDNDFSINNEEFFIVTGANMAGKSTFLRTVSLSIVMANCGLPVCAGTFRYSPIKLITSMRTSDSLTDDESYFYSELKRLKFIVDEIKEDTYFIILDEILKGTNSKDKAIGSKQFIEKLTKSKSTGIIATHDVSLCELADEYEQIQNYYFDAEIVNNELFFDYKMKDGVCKNMNASFLLQKMEIV
ncbi:DNA mismatch repair ATPase MutS [Tenacibaculum sp. MAR_2009_124]|uniref:MutS-related protein n=1 Tax=Tenacibaculum sp. MAR_2009_124 TaxID=1250059 RepID=UPI00089B9B2D|nr:DNA mismatch repair protein MutS [Tenacibaculum sp. MAR_2009_124]SEC47622.1 DNA mismatch repair ATPase MutS [Tenacibaculum sp. MAR_2009_124]